MRLIRDKHRKMELTVFGKSTTTVACNNED